MSRRVILYSKLSKHEMNFIDSGIKSNKLSPISILYKGDEKQGVMATIENDENLIILDYNSVDNLNMNTEELEYEYDDEYEKEIDEERLDENFNPKK